MHDAERAEENTDADAPAQPEQRHHHAEIGGCFKKEQKAVVQYDRLPTAEIADCGHFLPSPFAGKVNCAFFCVDLYRSMRGS